MASWTEKLPHIYLLTNNINGKIYVGQTNGNTKSYFASGILINKAKKKYGRTAFTKDILVKGDFSRKRLDELEIYFIKLLSANDRKYGYNKLSGGTGGSGLKHTPEAIEKIRIRSQQEDNKIRIREIQKIAAKNHLGTHRSQQTRLKISRSKRKSDKDRIIEQYDKSGRLLNTFYSITNAYEITGISKSNMKNNLYGLAATCNGFIFKFKEINI